MDDDGKEPEDEPPEPARDAAQDEGAKLREVSKDELKQILAAHETWVETDGKEGERADLSRADLREANLVVANLQEANLVQTKLQEAKLQEAKLQGACLIRANLQDAKIHDAKLQGADLQEANLQRAHLRGANLQNADLSDANLSKVTGLLAHQLAGANLSNAKLPKDIATFIALARAEKISRNCRAIFIGILTGCVYSLLTVATTTDARLLTNSASSPLPIIGTEVPIAHFYVAAPLILLFVYFYFQLYLQRLWTGLADLPAISPDGRPLDKRLYPWLINGFVRAHFKLLKDNRTFLQHMENCAIVVLAWWIVPLTVMLFWGRYLPRHDWFGTGLHITFLTVSIASALLFHQHAAATLRRDVHAFRWKRPWLDNRTHRAVLALGFGTIFALVSLGAIEGDAQRQPYIGGSIHLQGPATWVPYAFDILGYRTYANIRDADVSTKPATWTGLAERPPEELEKLDKTLVEKARAELALVKGARLQSADLRHANAVSAFLAKADLIRANLQGANLLGANLQKADLRLANLPGASLGGANLVGANLLVANLQKANLLGANLQKANLFGANLQGANLWLANLRGASLVGANLVGANLADAKLQGADLRGAKLPGADLTNAEGLTREQLDKACGNDETTLPDYLADYQNYLADYQMKPCPEPEQSPAN